jgi:hypothetical protein
LILGIDDYVIDLECHITDSRMLKFVTAGLTGDTVKDSKQDAISAIQYRSLNG